MARNARHLKILEIISEKPVETQEELANALVASGFNVTQATVSRDIKELGDFSKELHEKVGKEVIRQKIDILITVGEDAKFIAKEALEEGMNKSRVHITNSNEEAAKLLREIMKKGWQLNSCMSLSITVTVDEISMSITVISQNVGDAEYRNTGAFHYPA